MEAAPRIDYRSGVEKRCLAHTDAWSRSGHGPSVVALGALVPSRVSRSGATPEREGNLHYQICCAYKRHRGYLLAFHSHLASARSRMSSGMDRATLERQLPLAGEQVALGNA
jgi:hypothetical protein